MLDSLLLPDRWLASEGEKALRFAAHAVLDKEALPARPDRGRRPLHRFAVPLPREEAGEDHFSPTAAWRTRTTDEITGIGDKDLILLRAAGEGDREAVEGARAGKEWGEDPGYAAGGRAAVGPLVGIPTVEVFRG